MANNQTYETALLCERLTALRTLYGETIERDDMSDAAKLLRLQIEKLESEIRLLEKKESADS